MVNNKVLNVLAILFPLLGVLCVILYSATAGTWKPILQGFSVCFLLGGASFVFGGLIGFLFGIPRTVVDESNSTQRRYIPNTNLEKVSDWLTKVLIGAGLTQGSDILRFIKKIADYTAKDLSLFGEEAMFLSGGISYFGICGFFAGYLGTRIMLPKIFAGSEGDRGVEKQ